MTLATKIGVTVAVLMAGAVGTATAFEKGKKVEASLVGGGGPANGPQAAALVSIASPADKSVVKEAAVVSGSVDRSVGDDIWVFVWPEQAPGKGWPQSPDASKGAPAFNDRAGKWSTPVGFGGPAQSYDIAVYTAPKKISKWLGAKLKAWAQKNDYPGMTLNDLTGLVERHRIRVRKP
jgi:hypothetical protein